MREENYVDLGGRLRLARAEARLTLREAEERGGVNKDTISRVERGLHAPHWQTVVKLAEAYGLTTEELLDPLALAQR